MSGGNEIGGHRCSVRERSVLKNASKYEKTIAEWARADLRGGLEEFKWRERALKVSELEKMPKSMQKIIVC